MGYLIRFVLGFEKLLNLDTGELIRLVELINW